MLSGEFRATTTDNGRQFLSGEWVDFGEWHGIRLTTTTPYNPCANPVERVMKELGRIIRTYAHRNHKQWYLWLDLAERVINNTVHSATGFTPDELVGADSQEAGLWNRTGVGISLEKKLDLARSRLLARVEKRTEQSEGSYRVRDKVLV